MWVFAGGMQRSASTLQYQIASEIVEAHNTGFRVTWYDPGVYHEVFKKYGNSENYIIFKTHKATHEVIQLFRENKAMGLYIYRDIRDVISSLKKKNNCDYSLNQIKSITKNLLKEDKNWTSLPKVYVSRYEDVVGNIPCEIVSIADFLGITVSPSFVNRLSASLSLESQIKSIQNSRHSDSIISINSKNRFDQHTLLHVNHIDSSEHGRYKRNLRQDQLQVIKEIAGDWLTKRQYILNGT